MASVFEATTYLCVLSAVLAHKLHHWEQGDAIADRFLLSCALPMAMTYRVFMFLARPGGFLSTFAWGALLAVGGARPPGPRTGHGQGRRERELQADAAIRIGLGQGIYDALNQLGSTDLEGSRNSWQQAMLHSHPPTELRLDAIRHVAPKVREAPYA